MNIKAFLLWDYEDLRSIRSVSIRLNKLKFFIVFVETRNIFFQFDKIVIEKYLLTNTASVSALLYWTLLNEHLFWRLFKTFDDYWTF